MSSPSENPSFGQIELIFCLELSLVEQSYPALTSSQNSCASVCPSTKENRQDLKRESCELPGFSDIFGFLRHIVLEKPSTAVSEFC